MSTIQLFLFYWAGACFIAAMLYILAATGRLYCAAVFIGHCWSILKDEVVRPLRVIKKALSRKDINLDEHERFIS